LPSPTGAGEAALVQAEVEEVLEDLRKVRKRKKRHALWAIIGLSPAAVIPAVGLLMEGSLGLFVILCVLVTATQIIGWSKELKREGELEDRLRRLIGEA
jgi:hypothetical protein